MARKQKEYSLVEMEIRFAYLNKTVLERTLQAHQEKRYRWTPTEAKEINAMIEEAEELRLKFRSLQNINNNL